MKTSMRPFALTLCIALLLLCCSCSAGGGEKQAAGAPESEAESSSGKQTSDTTEPDPDDPVNLFVSRINETGIGLVREVPPFDARMTKPISLEERSQYVRWIGKDTGTADIRWLDCKSNLTAEQTQILLKAIPNITFNSQTIWPDSLPDSFDPAALLEAGKNPGLGVRALHDAGITGKGVSIAIIDQTLFTGHVEYRDNLALYEEIHVMEGEGASMHGAAVSSIAVGKNCGVAPDAKLYYWAVNLIKNPTKQVEQYTDNTIAFKSGLAAAMDRLLEVNETLPEEEKIRVVSISRGFSDLDDDGVKAFLAAVERAKDAGIFVITTSTYQYSADFMDPSTDFGGLGKADYFGDPDELSTYTLGTWEQSNAEAFIDKLLVPMDARTTADFTGEENYVFYTDGGWSWVAPYLAGLYALAVQVDPEITPDVFWTTARNTASQLSIHIDTPESVAHGLLGEPYTLTHVINPGALIDALKKQ